MRESGLTPMPVILDSRQQRIAVRLSNAFSSKLKELHKNPSSGKPICRVVKFEHTHDWTTKEMSWSAPGKNQWLNPLYCTRRAQPREQHNTGEERRKRKFWQESGCGGQMDHTLTMGVWE
jgi:hypothetical protein